MTDRLGSPRNDKASQAMLALGVGTGRPSHSPLARPKRQEEPPEPEKAGGEAAPGERPPVLRVKPRARRPLGTPRGSTRASCRAAFNFLHMAGAALPDLSQLRKYVNESGCDERHRTNDTGVHMSPTSANTPTTQAKLRIS